MSYTVVDTIILGAIFVILTYLSYLLLKKLKINIEKNVFLGIFLWVLAAAFVRVFEDAGIYPNFFFIVTPGIVLTFAGILAILFYFGSFLEKKKKIKLWKTLSISALFVIIPHIPFFKIRYVNSFLALVFFLIIFGIMLVLNEIINLDFFSFSALASHMFDASVTFTSIQFFGYVEKHVLPNFLINLFGPFVMFPLKLIFLIPVIYLINKNSEEKLRRFLLLVIFVMGIAPGLRNMLRLAMGI